MMTENTAKRRYRGASGAERALERRDRLLRAAISIYGDTGYRNATVKAVCEAAGLTERYFYESFADSEALLLAAYARVNAQLIAEIEQLLAAHPGDAAAQGQAALGYYFTALRQDPKLARMFLVELSGVSPAAARAQSEAQAIFAALLLRTLDPQSLLPPAQRDLLAHGVVGAIAGMALLWINETPPRPLDEVVAAALAICGVLRT
jgi:AcrR family transcriptional regulator